MAFSAPVTISQNTAQGGSGYQAGSIPAGSIDLAPLCIIHVPFAAGGGGAADDVTVFASALPQKIRVIDCKLRVQTNVAGSTCTLRTATGGGGTALSSAMSSNATGVILDGLTTATQSVNAGASLYIRRSDSGVAGELLIYCLPEY